MENTAVDCVRAHRAAGARQWRVSLCFAMAGVSLASISACSVRSAAQSVQPAPPTVVAPHEAVVLPSLEVRLSRSVYRIQADPKSGAAVMPKDVVASAVVLGWPTDVPQPQAFTWHVFLDWDFKPYPTHHSINNAKLEHSSPFQVNFGSEVRGGRLKVIAKTSFQGHDIVGQALAEVRGDNPPRSAVLRAFPPNRLGLIASKIATAESGMRQFETATGMPMVSRTNDVGMMQLNAPTNAITSADQVWDWRANLKRGLEMMDDKRRTTVLASRGTVSRHPDPHDVVAGYEDAVCLNFLRWYLGMQAIAPPVIPPLSSQPGTGMLPGEADPDHLALSQIERDAIRRYNGGREYALALVTDPETLSIRPLEWQVDPTRGGIRVRSGDPDYIGHVLRARSGFVIPAPPKAARTKHRHLRHRRRK